MAWKLSRSYEMQCAHRLTGVPEDHKCYNLHGHTYVVTVTVEADKLDERGFAGLDFAELDTAFENDVMAYIDHRYLNEAGDTAPHGTTEEFAKTIYDRIRATVYPARLVSVAISENSRSLIEYSL